MRARLKRIREIIENAGLKRERESPEDFSGNGKNTRRTLSGRLAEKGSTSKRFEKRREIEI